MAFERCAQVDRRGDALGGAPFLRGQHIALLFENLVDILVLVADLLDQLLQLLRIIDPLRGELAQPAGGAARDQTADDGRIADGRQRPRQRPRALASGDDREQQRAIDDLATELVQVDRSRIDEASEARLGRQFRGGTRRRPARLCGEPGEHS